MNRISRFISTRLRQAMNVNRPGVARLLILLSLPMYFSSLSARQLTLEQAVSRFLQRSPLVAAEREKIGIARGALRQAGAWANPILFYTQENFPIGRSDSGFDDQELSIGAWQEFELGGRRGKRRDLARLKLDAEEARFQDFVRRERLSVSRLFVAVAYASERKEAMDLALQRYSSIRGTHSKRRELGEVSGLAQMKIEVEELGFLVELARAEREFNASWSELSTLIGWEYAVLPEYRVDESERIALPDRAALIGKALESRPDLLIEQLETLAARKEIELEKAKNIPNLNLGAGYKRDFGQDSFYLSVQLPLPLWDRRQGAIASKLAAGRRRETLSNWKRTWIRFEVERAYGLVSKLTAAAQRLDSAFLKRLNRTVEITALSYREGEAGILDYLEALRTQRDSLLARNRLLEELHLARLELEASVGVPLRDIRP